MRNKGLVATIVIMSGVIVTLLVILLVINMPTIISIGDIKEKVIERVVDPKSTEGYYETEPIKIDVPEVTADIKTFEGFNGAVSIDYPEISGLNDLNQQAKINNKIKMNALSIVSLYPVSTALQKLNINCEIDYLDKKYITIIYSGTLTGSEAKKKTATYENTYTPSYTPKASDLNDPYLNGFVDPLANMNNINANINNVGINNNINTNANQNSISNFNTNINLPTPEETQAVGSVIGNISGTNSSSTSVGPSNNSSTSDSGPTVTEILSPTAKSSAGIKSSGNQLTPGEQNTSNTPISPISNAPSSSNAPISSNTSNASNASNASNIPSFSTSANGAVYSYSTSKATNVDQKIYFTNTLDLEYNVDLTLSNYWEDIEVLAKYARSSDAEYVNVDSSDRAEVMAYIKKTPLTTLIKELKQSDFRNETLTTWPKHFSYEDKDGNIYFTIKLTTKLGNYVIIKYSK